MGFKSLFKLAEKKNITPFEVRYSSKTTLSISFFQDQIDNYTSATDSSIYARGIFEGKLGSFYSDKTDKSVYPLIVEQVLDHAKFGIEGNPDFFIKPGMKYKKVKNYYKALEKVTPKDLLEIGKKVFEIAKSLDTRVDVIQTSISLDSAKTSHANSNGLDLKEKSNLLSISSSIQAKDEKEIQSAFEVEYVTDLEKFDVEAYAKKLVKKVINQFGGVSIPSNKYNIVLNNETAASLVSALMGHVSSYQVKHHLSVFEGKVGEQVFSKKLTILDNPLAKTVFASSFDGEGVPTQKTTIIDKGVLKTFIYDLAMAKEFKTTSTGNGHLSGAKVVPDLNFIEVKKGKLPFDKLLEKVKDGIYVTSLEGLGTGLNETSGNYSLQASGFVIKDGKIEKPISLMTVSGNLFKDFNRVIEVGADQKVTYFGVESPSIALSEVSISCE